MDAYITGAQPSSKIDQQETTPLDIQRKKKLNYSSKSNTLFKLSNL